MSKILITADIHFDSYPNRTPTEGYRLNQSYQVVENLLEIGRREQAEYIFILGDILEKQNRDAPIHSVVKNCLYKLMTGFKDGYYILGNHDMNARSIGSESTENDMLGSYLHLYAPDSLHYVDKKVIDIDGVSFGFRNYSSAETLDLSFIEESGRKYIDVLLGHSSQSYQDDDPPYMVQSYDESKVGLAFFGHIHQSVCKGNKVSVGVPQRCKITDDTPRVIIYDTSFKSWKYVDADPAKKLMDFKETTTAVEDYFDKETNTYYIVKKKPTENAELLKAVASTGYDKIFESEIKNRGLQEIHRAVKDMTPVESLEKLDLDFQITELKIHNWRSIKDFSIKFPVSGKYLVSGQNGSGKSSMYSALAYGLSGKCSGLLKDNLRFGEKDLSVEVSLIYHGIQYVIKRGTSILEFWKSGTLQELGNKNQTKEGIIKELPFIEAMDLLYYNDGNQRILGQSSASDTSKLQILYKILGLNEIDAYNATAINIQKKLTKDFEKTHDSYVVSEASIKEKKDCLDSLELRFSGVEKFDPKKRIEELRQTLKGYQELYRAKQKYDQQVQENSKILTEISGTELLLKTISKKILALESPETLNPVKSKLSETLTETKKKLSSLLSTQSEYSKLSGRKEFVVREGVELKKQLQELEEEATKPVICKTYGIPCPAVTEEMKRKSLESRKIDLETKRKEKLSEYYEISEALKKLKSEPEEIQKVTQEVSSIQLKISEINGKINEYNSLTTEYSTKNNYLETLKSKTLENQLIPPDLPVDLLTRITSLTSEISTLEGYQRLHVEYEKAVENHKKLKENFDKETKILSGYQDYITLTKPSGVIYTKIFEIIMTSFSDPKIRYEVNITKRGESRYINIMSYLHKIGKDEVSYSNASQGEKCMMDIHFLSNLQVKFGLLILDEFLGNLDQDNHDEALKKMQSLETNLLFVTSHKENLIPFPNHIEASIIGDETHYKIG